MQLGMLGRHGLGYPREVSHCVLGKALVGLARFRSVCLNRRVSLPKLSPALRSLLVGLALTTPAIAFARPAFVSSVPNADINGCQTCHAGAPPAFNPFGQAIFDTALDRSNGTSTLRWSANLARLDSDGDGVSNGAELGDAAGQWRMGLPAPGNSVDITQPGDPASVSDLPASAPVLGPVGWASLCTMLLALGVVMGRGGRVKAHAS